MTDAPIDDQQSAIDEQQVIGAESTAPRTAAEQQQTAAAEDYRRTSDDKRPSMHVKVYAPFQTYYDDQAFSISADNATGPFDILPRHHNFISLLSACELVIRGLRDDEKHIRISGGLMHVKADQVIVFLDV